MVWGDFSAKMANKIETILKPLLGPGGKYEAKVKVIFRLQVQPWHSSSTLTHEAGLAASHYYLHPQLIGFTFIQRSFVYLLKIFGDSVSKSVRTKLYHLFY